MKTLFSFCLAFLLTSTFLFAQVKSINGTVIDQKTKEPLSYATIHIPNTLIGTITNDAGYFELKVPTKEEEITFSYIGYEDQTISLKKVKLPLKVKLGLRAVNLEEIVVRSMSPLDYIIAAVEAYPKNICDQPFDTRGYFHEKSSMQNDNSGAYQLNEAVFKSHIPSFSDTSKSIQNQLALFRVTNEGKFRSILLDNKRIKKRVAKDKKRDGDTSPITDEEMEEKVDINIEDVTGGGPSEVLEAAQTLLDLAFLDADNFKKINYTFGENSYYKNRDLIVIDFVTKRKIDHSRFSGSIYLDYENLSIIALDYDVKFKVPFLINVLIKAIIGLTISDVNQVVSIKNQIFENKLYPKELVKDISITFLQQKEPETMRLKQLFSIDQIITENPNEIPTEKLFSRELEYAEQVFSIEGLSWDAVNVVK